MRKLQILGTGCPKCKQLSEAAEQAARDSGIDYEIEKVTDVTEIVKFGVMMTPALAVDGEVRVAGRIPGTDEIRAILTQT